MGCRVHAGLIAAGYLAVVVAGCDPPEPIRIVTEVDLTLPEGDHDARKGLQRLVLEVWNPAAGACMDLLSWRTSVCGRPCETPLMPRARGQRPVSTATTTREAGAAWAPVQLRVGAGTWDVAIFGSDSAGATFVYGCAAVAEGEPVKLPLWRPWCDVASCPFHAACGAVPVCMTSSTPVDRFHLAPPICEPIADQVLSWEQGGVPCVWTSTAAPFAPCKNAKVRCAAGAMAPEEDGVCPRPDLELACEPPGTVAVDHDCDGRVPGPCEGDCTAGETLECHRPGAPHCTGTSSCADGKWGHCVFAAGVNEPCNDQDDDCDGIQDAFDEDALAACNAHRRPRYPAADRCRSGSCVCANEPACGDGLTCCARGCKNTARDPDNCGSCGVVCPGRICLGGRCGPTPIDGGPGNDGAADAGADASADAATDGFSAPDARAADALRLDGVVRLPDTGTHRDGGPANLD